MIHPALRSEAEVTDFRFSAFDESSEHSKNFLSHPLVLFFSFLHKTRSETGKEMRSKGGTLFETIQKLLFVKWVREYEMHVG